MTKRHFREYIDHIKSRIVFIVGNHDYQYRKIIKEKVEEVYDLTTIKIKNQLILLCHYPLYFHDRSHYNAWQLYGHKHYDVSEIVQGKKMNVNLELHGYKTLSFDDVKAYMDTRDGNHDLKNDFPAKDGF